MDTEKVVVRYRELRNMVSVARECGVSPQRIKQILNQAGVDTSARSKPKVPKEKQPAKKAGRHPAYEGMLLTRMTLTVRPDDVVFLTETGAGNASVGLRRLIDEAHTVVLAGSTGLGGSLKVEEL